MSIKISKVENINNNEDSILDLARNHEIKIEQDSNFCDIYLLGGTS